LEFQVEASRVNSPLWNIFHDFAKNGIPILALIIDNFVFPTDQRNRHSNAAKSRYSDTYDFNTLINQVVRTLRENNDINGEYLQIDRKRDQQVFRRIEFNGPGVILVEGIQLFRRAFINMIDFKIWMELGFEEGLRRAVSRRNHLGVVKSSEQIEQMYINRSSPGYERYVKMDSPSNLCDVIIDSTRPIS